MNWNFLFGPVAPASIHPSDSIRARQGGISLPRIRTAVGYSASNASSLFPSIYSTGRVPTDALGASPTSQSVNPGRSASYDVTVTGLNTYRGSVSFSVSGLPLGATPTFNPGSVKDSGSTTLTIATANWLDVNLNVYTQTALSLRKQAVNTFESVLEQPTSPRKAQRVM